MAQNRKARNNPARLASVVPRVCAIAIDGRRMLRSVAQRLKPADTGARRSPGTMEPLAGWSRSVEPDGEQPKEPVIVAVLVYHGVSSSEVEIVADALAAALEADVRLVSADVGEVSGVEPARTIIAEPLDSVPEPYGLVVPGGLAWRKESARPEVLAWLDHAVSSARGVITVSTGSLLLAAIGTLDGREAASHWLAGDLLTEFGATLSNNRTVHGRLLVTASGAMSGAEAAAELAKEMRFSF